MLSSIASGVLARANAITRAAPHMQWRCMSAAAGTYEHLEVEVLPNKVALIRLNRPKVCRRRLGPCQLLQWVPAGCPVARCAYWCLTLLRVVGRR